MYTKSFNTRRTSLCCDCPGAAWPAEGAWLRDTRLVVIGNKLWDSLVVCSWGWRGLELIDEV